jgi:hypothetical protein
MTDRFESILDESISALQAGVPLEEILAEVPEYASQLRTLLFAAMVLTDPKPELAPAEKKASLRAEYLRQVTELPAFSPSPFREKAQAVFRVIKKRTTRAAVLNDLVTVTLTVVMTLLALAASLHFLALTAIPGDFLYGIKRGSESIQLTLTFNPQKRAALDDAFNQQRLGEIEQLIDRKRAAVVQFKGQVETKGENLWIIEKHTVLLPSDISNINDIREGDTVEIIGLLRTNNVLVADSIRLVRLPAVP